MGDFRYNTQETKFEVYTGTDWVFIAEQTPEIVSPWAILMRVDGRKDISRNETPLGNPKLIRSTC
jgi:hypothetical protein